MTDKERTPQEHLLVSAKRLERLLGGNSHSAMASSSASASSTAREKKSVVEVATTMMHSNPSKIVKRWLGTSSGVSKKLSLTDVSFAAQNLLDPSGSSATGRDILSQLATVPPSETMEVEGNDDDDDNDDNAKKEEIKFAAASSRELEAYLLSHAIRILWAQGGESTIQQAFDLSVKAIQIVSVHIDEAESSLDGITGIGAGSATGLYPLLSRLYRYQGLVSESMEGAVLMKGARKEQLIHAHRMAVVRRDIDTQATILNLMLRELLNSDEGESDYALHARSECILYCLHVISVCQFTLTN
jgi:hypothetical protein